MKICQCTGILSCLSLNGGNDEVCIQKIVDRSFTFINDNKQLQITYDQYFGVSGLSIRLSLTFTYESNMHSHFTTFEKSN